MVAIQDYKDREQAYVKRVFLERYLERLVHKTASRYDHIVYIDGFKLGFRQWTNLLAQFGWSGFGNLTCLT